MKSVLYLVGFAMLFNAGLSMINCKSLYWHNQMLDRKKVSEAHLVVSTLDIKIEIMLSLVVLMIASVKSYLAKDSLRNIAVTNSYLNK